MSEHRMTLTEPSLNPLVEQLVTIKINGIELQVPKGENVIESARRAGVDIPYFCYHPRLSKGDAANCRMCLVDVAMPGPDGNPRKMPKPQAACTMPAAEGMVIETETPGLIKDRKGVLEFLLINHPLDCPICDRGGECPLQNNVMFYGPPMSRYIEEKRHFPKAYPLSDHVVFDRERCIHCARCTRFTDDISGDSQLGFLKRGADMEVGTHAQTKFESKFSGNVIELCPVGALLSREYRFKARPWDLMTQASVCSNCSNGCNIKIDYRLDTLQRINARVNEEVNEEWTCDKGKFGHDYVSAPNRLKKPIRKVGGAWQEIEWSEAYRLIAENFGKAEGKVGGIGGQRCTNEDNFAFQKFFRTVLKSNNIDSRTGRYQGGTNSLLFDRFGHHGMGNSIADLEGMKSFLLLGTELADEQPIIYLRVRKAWRFKGASVINAVTSIPSDTVTAAEFAAVNLVYKPGSEIALLNGILNVMFAEKLIPKPDGADTVELQKAVAPYTPERTELETGLSAESVKNAALLLAKNPTAIIVGKSVTESSQFAEIVAVLGNLLAALGTPGNLNVPGYEVNSQGAMDMGVLPDMAPGYKPLDTPGMSTSQMLESAANGDLQALWIVGAKLAENYHDIALVDRALKACPFVVVNELHLTDTAQLADLVLPAASFAEKDGTFTNCERRVQRISKAFDVAPDIKPDWLIFTEIGAQMGGGSLYFTARDVIRDIAATVPQYAGINYRSLGEFGVRWQYAGDAAKPIDVKL